jgi:hypothetical protein
MIEGLNTEEPLPEQFNIRTFNAWLLRCLDKSEIDYLMASGEVFAIIKKHYGTQNAIEWVLSHIFQDNSTEGE